MKITHMRLSTTAPRMKARPRRRDVIVGDMDVGVDQPQHHEYPRHHDEQQIGVACHQGEDRQYVEENRHLELIVEGIADLAHPRRPVRLAQGDVPRLHCAGLEGVAAQIAHPVEQHEGQHAPGRTAEAERLGSTCA